MNSKKKYNQVERKAIGNALVIMRKQMGLTQVDIVKKLGYSRPTINSIEKGTANYMFDQLLDYCRLLDLKITII